MHTCPGTLEEARQSTIRRAHACTDSDAEHFEHPCELWLDKQ